MENRAGRHEQQGFVKNMTERVRNCPVDGQFSADAHAAHHKPHLIDQAVGQHPADVILQHSVKIGMAVINAPSQIRISAPGKILAMT